MSPSNRYYNGPLQPDYWNSGTKLVGPLLPDPNVADEVFIPANPPGTAATFVLSLDVEASVTYRWRTQIVKFRSGREKRVSRRKYPQKRVEGATVLESLDQIRTHRGSLAKYASSGKPFGIALPWDSIGVDDWDGDLVYFNAAFDLDWCVVGQPVVVETHEGDVIQAVIQEVGAGVVRLDVTIDVDQYASSMMPIVPVFLNPTLSMNRIPQDAETSAMEVWNVGGVVVPPTYFQAARRAVLPLEEPLTNSGALGSAYVEAVNPGTDSITFSMNNNALSDDGEVEEDVGAGTVVFKFIGGDTTVQQMATAINGTSELIRVKGNWTDLSILQDVEDEFGPTPLGNGFDGSLVDPGMYPPTFYLGSPVWTHEINVDDEAAESILARTELLDIGGKLENNGPTRIADWMRHMSMIRDIISDDHHWLIGMLHYLRGSWKSFWLPTWRADLEYAGHYGANPLHVLIQRDTVSGDFQSWYPSNRRHVMFLLHDGTQVYREIKSFGSIEEDPDVLRLVLSAARPAVDTVAMTSWLELVRLGSDEITISYEGSGFALETSAMTAAQNIDPVIEPEEPGEG